MQSLLFLKFGFDSNPILFIGFVFGLGAMIGSFLNVVIHRLPIMMEREFKASCSEYFPEERKNERRDDEQSDQHQEQTPDELDIQYAVHLTEEKYNLVVPRSKCPKCNRQIKSWENIPILSYVFMRGKCVGCKTHISLQYPFVELMTGLLSAYIAYRFGVTWECLAALFLTWCLVALTGIDIKTQLLPDVITLPLMWLGILLATQSLFVDLESAVWGAVFGYLSLWTMFHLFKLATGKEGMGYGDFKLLAALGAWMGASMLPLILIMSTLVGSVIGLAMIVLQGRDKAQPLAFGPYLAIAGWIAFLWGDRMMGAYLNTLQ